MNFMKQKEIRLSKYTKKLFDEVEHDAESLSWANNTNSGLAHVNLSKFTGLYGQEVTSKYIFFFEQLF